MPIFALPRHTPPVTRSLRLVTSINPGPGNASLRAQAEHVQRGKSTDITIVAHAAHNIQSQSLAQEQNALSSY